MRGGRMLQLLDGRAASGRPLRLGLVGAGTFGSMLLSQARRLRGLEVAGVADLAAERARAALVAAGWDEDEAAALVVDSCEELLGRSLDVLVEATGSPEAGLTHALAAFERGCHVVNVTVEADVLAGPLLTQRARAAGVVYSLAYGDQPALVCELVDWARASGFEVVCAGKGTKFLPAYHAITPDTVWEHYGLTLEQIERGGFSARMFTSFIDGTKSAVELAAICNATGLEPPEDGLRFPPCSADRLASVCVPREAGGVLSRSGTVEVVSSLERDGSGVPNDLRWGVYVVFAAPSDRVAEWFRAYGLTTDEGGRFAALYRPSHLIGLETTVSVLSAGLLGEPTGAPDALRADVVAVAKRDLAAGETLDGEGGFCVYGALVTAAASLREGLLPAGLSEGLTLSRAVRAGETVRLAVLTAPPDGAAAALRAELARSMTVG